MPCTMLPCHYLLDSLARFRGLINLGAKIYVQRFGKVFFNNKKISICLSIETVLAEGKEQWDNDIWKLHTFRTIRYEYGTLDMENYVVCCILCI